jgi:ketosteroid isomerase-like protein
MKLPYYLFIAFLFFYSCNEVQNKNTASAANIKIVTQLFDYFNAHDWPKMASLYSDTANFKDPSFGIQVVKQSQAQTIKKYSELQAFIPNIHDSITAMYASGEKNIIVEFTSTGTMLDGQHMELPICAIFTLQEGKIVGDYTYYDNQ